jgi:hypothetical protein
MRRFDTFVISYIFSSDNSVQITVVQRSRMRTKKKMSVTIDAEILEALEKAAKTCNMAKSQLAQEAFRLWFKKRTEESMAAGYFIYSISMSMLLELILAPKAIL